MTFFNGLIRRHRATVITGVLSVTGLALAGCNDDDSTLVSPNTDPASAVSTTGTATESADASTTAPTPAATTYTFSWTDDGGVTIKGEMRLAAPVVANDPSLSSAWSSVGVDVPDALSCVDNPARDGVVAGSVSFVNPTPDYSPSNVDLRLYAKTNLNDPTIQLEYEIHYGNESGGCSPVIWPGDAAMRPSMDAARWGPVPIAFVVSDMYGPAGADTDRYYAAQNGLAFGPNLSVSPGRNMSGDDHFANFRLPSPESDEVAGDSAAAGNSLPSCESVWLDGQTLPADYAGCLNDDGSASQDAITSCDDGSTLVQLDGWGYAFAGDTITSDRGGAYHDPALEAAAQSACVGS